MSGKGQSNLFHIPPNPHSIRNSILSHIKYDFGLRLSQVVNILLYHKYQNIIMNSRITIDYILQISSLLNSEFEYYINNPN